MIFPALVTCTKSGSFTGIGGNQEFVASQNDAILQKQPDAVGRVAMNEHFWY
jgi:hypothetical protein